MLAWLGAMGLGAAMLIPNALVCVGARLSTACFRTFEEPRGAELPWCGDVMGWYSFPSRVPWTITPATYRAEELRIRIAIGQYQNAIVGHPNRTARSQGAVRMEEAATIVKTGSKRLAFEELGPAVGAPDPGQDALLSGDRDTLLHRAKDWGEWHVRLHTLQAALLEADLERTLDIAKHYATYDPRDEDLRSALGAILCLFGDRSRAIELLVLQQDDRASRRYAAMSRNWGDVRTAILACAAIDNKTPPPRPLTSEAGQDDQREVRAPLRLRVVKDHDNRLREAQESAEQLLSNVLSVGSRAPILASLLASGYELEPARWVELSRARIADGEPHLLDMGSVNVISWLEIPRDRPILTGGVFEKGATRLLEIAKDATDEDRPALELAAGALLIESARAYVRAADATSALEMLHRAAPLAKMDATTRALAEALVLYATGDAKGAHKTLEHAPKDAGSKELLAAFLALRAEVSGNGGPPSRDEAKEAYEAAKNTESAALRSWSMRILFWASPDDGAFSSPEPGPTITALDPMAGRFSLWPSLGYANKTVAWAGPDDNRLPILAKNLGIWGAARAATDNDKRAFRYAFLRRRGDMPDAMVPYLAVAAEIAGEGADPEIWLDAVMATDATRFSLRTYAWARAQAARGRGAEKEYTLWTNRQKTLAKLLGDEKTAELARFLGI